MNTYFYIPRWPVLYHDNHLLALYKPAGLLVQGDRTRDITLLELAKHWIKKKFQKPGQVYLGLVHRLDRPVAGVVLFCRTSKAAGRISQQFRSGHVQKRYITIVEGAISNPSGQLFNYIERRGSSAKIVSSKGQKSTVATLSYRVLDVFQSRSLLEIDLHTGRHHQIRVQLSHWGFPVLGDLRYGASQPLPHRQIALFAHSISIDHPTRYQRFMFTSSLPSGWPWPQPAAHADPPPWAWPEIKDQVMDLFWASDPDPDSK